MRNDRSAGSGEVDTLTGLSLYETFSQCLEAALVRAAKQDGSVSMALFDIDHFARLNEKHGSDTGDQVLVAIAGHLREAVGDRGEVFRYGGDAFAIVFEGVPKEDAFLMTEQARAGFHNARTEQGMARVSVGLSAGLAACPDDGSDETTIVRKANEALYRAKVSGMDKVCLAREEKMVTKTSHYTQGQLQGLTRLSKRMGMGEAELLREALDDLLRKYNA
jgi:diguanylate cyclase (GGDEF)-like protein